METAELLLKVLGWALLAYACIVVPAWLFQHRLLYLASTPGRDWVATPTAVGLDHETLRLATEDGVEISAWWVPAVSDRGALLFFHGNAGNISHRLESIQIFNRLGLSVLIIDYRGYGLSTGKPSESGTYLDAQAAWRHLIEDRGRSSSEIVVFGRSMGAAIAARLASTVATPPAALIVESPFSSAPDIAQQAYPFLPARWLTRFSYATRDYVADVGCPVLVIHSETDEIIPIEHGRDVFEAAPEPKRFLALRGGHNTGFLESLIPYTRGIDGFLAETAALARALDRSQAGD
jgi:alpha-beta hydrolase superfamily lysophospholipase